MTTADRTNILNALEETKQQLPEQLYKVAIESLANFVPDNVNRTKVALSFLSVDLIANESPSYGNHGEGNIFTYKSQKRTLTRKFNLTSRTRNFVDHKKRDEKIYDELRDLLFNKWDLYEGTHGSPLGHIIEDSFPKIIAWYDKEYPERPVARGEWIAFCFDLTKILSVFFAFITPPAKRQMFNFKDYPVGIVIPTHCAIVSVREEM